MGTEATKEVAFHPHLLGYPLALPCYLHWHLPCGFCGRGHSPNQPSSSPDCICNINNSICPRKLGWRYSELFCTRVLQRGTSEMPCAFHPLSPHDSSHHHLFHRRTQLQYWTVLLLNLSLQRTIETMLPTRGRLLGKTAFLETCNVNRLLKRPALTFLIYL